MSREKVFRFKQFAVLNDRTAMKVGTDGVLLGAWCSVGHGHRVLDVGTGCGVIALMLAQRDPLAVVDAIDIDADAIGEATHNFAQSPWPDRLTACVVDFNQLQGTARATFDLIVSNPPFFSDGVLPPDPARRQARHGVTLTLRQLVSQSAHLLSDDGLLAMITPVEAADTVTAAAAEAGMCVMRCVPVVAVEGASPRRLLWQLARNLTQASARPDDEPAIVIAHRDGSYTAEYTRLVHDFYLWA